MIARGKLKDADALVWDLRDGWGGAQPRLSRPVQSARADHAGDGPRRRAGLVNVKWRKPVAHADQRGTRSGKEVLAYGFKKYGLGPVIGTRTEGAVLAARAFLIGDDSLLLLAVDDVRVDGAAPGGGRRRADDRGAVRPALCRRQGPAARSRRAGAGAELK